MTIPILARESFGFAAYFQKLNTTTSLTTAGTATTNALNLINLASAATITMPTPTPGDMISLFVDPSSAGDAKLDAGVVGIIASRARYLTLLPGNSIILAYNGLNSSWVSVAENLNTRWIDGGTCTIEASTTNPTKGTTSIDKVMYRRVGDSMHVRWNYRQTAAGTAGTGSYRLKLPSTYLINGGLLASVAEGSTKQVGEAARLGHATVQDIGTTDGVGSAFYIGLGNAVGVGVLNGPGTTQYAWGASGLPFSLANLGFAAEIVGLPITDW